MSATGAELEASHPLKLKDRSNISIGNGHVFGE